MEEQESKEEESSRPAKAKPKGSPAAHSAAKSGGSKQGSGKEKKHKKNNDDMTGGPRSARTIHQFLPYLWGVLGIFILVMIILIDFAKLKDALGPVGYWLNNILFGLMGYGGFAAPFVLLVLAYRWRRIVDSNQLGRNIVFSFLIIVVFSAVIHAISHHAPDEAFSIPRFFCEGCGITYQEVEYSGIHSGGVLGGMIGFAFVKMLSLVGTLIILIAVLIFLTMLLVGITPQRLWTEIRFRSKNLHDSNVEKRQLKKEEKARLASTEPDVNRRLEAGPSGRKPGMRYDTSNYDEVHGLAEEEPEQKEQGTADRTDEPVLNREALDPGYEPKSRQQEKETAAAGKKNRAEAFGVGDSFLSDDESVSSREEDEPSFIETDETLDLLNDETEEAIPLPPAQEAKTEEEDSEPEKDITFLSGQEDEDPTIVNFGEPKPEKTRQAKEKKTEGKATITKVEQIDDEAFRDLVDTEPAAEEKPKQKKQETVEYKFPPVDLLNETDSSKRESDEVLVENMRRLEETLDSFKIKIRGMTYSSGPTVTRYELRPDAGIRVRNIANLSDDIAMALAANGGIRIEAPIPGKDAVGIEVPNRERATVGLRELITSPLFTEAKSKTTACLGADITGNPVVFDISKMPHILVAGTTGSGKSVCINSIIMSILYKATPDEVKLILIDPKAVEFTVYKDIPHLYSPIISDPKKAAGALATAVGEMERRFSLMAEVEVRDVKAFNEATKNDPSKEYLPSIIIIIDELADLMMVAKNDVETSICRIAQKARAAGIHLILGTQRPSVDVITGLMKANVPSKIAFTVGSLMDSRVILDQPGAEKLCGRGDMLFSPVGSSKPQRVQGTFVDDSEVSRVVEYVKTHNESAHYNEEFIRQMETEAARLDKSNFEDEGGEEPSGGVDQKFVEALEVAVEMGKISTSLLQRKIKIGYGRAAGILDQMQEMNFIGPPDGSKPRAVLITKDEFLELVAQGRFDN